jgi:hypothetical protein
MLSNKWRSAFVAAVVTLGVAATSVPAGATTASAAAEAAQRKGTCAELTGAIGCFESFGDHIYVHDDDADGRRPSVQWETDYGRSGECTWTGRSYWTDCNYNMREDSSITFRLVLRSGSQFWAAGWYHAYVGA